MYKCSCANSIDKKTMEVLGYNTEYAYSINDYKRKSHKKVKNSFKWQPTNKEKTMFTLKNDCLTFDIETSLTPDKTQSYIYHWQMCVFGDIVFGRTIDQFQDFLTYIIKEYGIDKSHKVICYVHNLSYEFQFTYQFIDILLSSIFAMDSHEVLYFNTSRGVEFRCSYKLSGESLPYFIANTPNASHFKGKGDLDYSKIRTPKTRLTDKEKGYCYNDVKGLYEAVMYKMEREEGGGFCSIPLTSTGYVRREFRKIAVSYKALLKKLIITTSEYKELKACFRGGNTASNRHHVGEILDKIGSYDITSSYPYVMCALKEFPMSKFMNISPSCYSQLCKLNDEYCTMGYYTFKNIELKDDVPVPYIPKSKVIACNKGQNGLVYNGRIIKADKITIALTNIDFNIIKDQYTYEGIAVAQFKIANKGFLPEEYRKLVLSFFINKTTFKGVDEENYQTAKKLVNGCYGMSVTSLDKFDILLDIDTGEWSQSITKTSEDYDTQLKKKIKAAYEGFNAYTAYQWGVWVSALARMRLQEMLDVVGDDVVYCDTDSIKYLNPEAHNQEFEKKNDEIMAYLISENLRLSATAPNGKVCTLGTWDCENLKGKSYAYDQFITLGAKKYAYSIDGKIGVTVAGLGKKQGAAELQRCHGLQTFRDGHIFVDSGRTTSSWVNAPIHQIQVNGEEITTGSCLVILPTTYTLSMDAFITALDNAS